MEKWKTGGKGDPVHEAIYEYYEAIIYDYIWIIWSNMWIWIVGDLHPSSGKNLKGWGVKLTN